MTEDAGTNPASPKGSALKAWLQLVRLPNLLTVPGDPIAGFLLAKAATGKVHGALLTAAGIATGVSLLLYMCGLVDNDLADLAEDCSERPHRPLPSGRIGVRAARVVCGMLGAAGLCLAAINGWTSFTVAAVLLAAIVLYNHAAKKILIVGPLLMGSCRALSLLVGAVAAGWRGELSLLVLVPAAMLWLYVAAVTAIAAGETRAEPLGLRRWLPAIVLAAGFGAMGYAMFAAGFNGWSRAPMAGGTMAVWAALVGWRLSGQPQPAVVQASIGKLIRGLLMMQFIFAAVAGAPIVVAGAAFVGPWFLNAQLARRFYAS